MQSAQTLSYPQFDVHDRAFLYNPLSAFEELREHWPIFYHEQLKGWLLTRHDDVVPLLRDPRLSTDFTKATYGPKAKPLAEQSDFEKIFTFGTAQLTPKDHHRIRKLALPAFSVERLGPTRTRLQNLADRLVATTAGKERFNFVDEIAGKMPMGSICELLQMTIDDAHFDDFITFVMVLLRSANNMYLDMAKREEDARLAQPGYDFIKSVIDDRRAHLQTQDFLSDLIQASEDNERISNDELIALICALLTAGTSSAVHLQNRLLWNLHLHPDQDQLLRANPDLIQPAIMEVLRFDFFQSATMIGIRRYALEDFDWKGNHIRKGDTLILQMGAAHRDPRAFDQADQFIIERDQSENHVFGIGPHFCMGNMLARAEVEAVYRALIDRYPNYAIDGVLEVREDDPSAESALWMLPGTVH